MTIIFWVKIKFDVDKFRVNLLATIHLFNKEISPVTFSCRSFKCFSFMTRQVLSANNLGMLVTQALMSLI